MDFKTQSEKIFLIKNLKKNTEKNLFGKINVNIEKIILETLDLNPITRPNFKKLKVELEKIKSEFIYM